MDIEIPKTLSVPEAGKRYFNLAKNASYQAARSGDLPVIKIGGRLRVPVTALERMLTNAYRGGPQAMTLDPRAVARALGGIASRQNVLAPGPGHSRADRSLSIKIDPTAPDGFILHSFAGDSPTGMSRSRARRTWLWWAGARATTIKAQPVTDVYSRSGQRRGLPYSARAASLERRARSTWDGGRLLSRLSRPYDSRRHRRRGDPVSSCA